MTIDEALKIIKDGRIAAAIIKGNTEDDTKFNQENIEALNMIIDTMYKYQEIRKIYMTHHYTDEEVIEKIKEIIKWE